MRVRIRLLCSCLVLRELEAFEARSSPFKRLVFVASLRRIQPPRAHQDDDCVIYDDDNDDDLTPDVDVSSWSPPKASFGLNRGRSSPSQRKAFGSSASAVTRVHLCTNCGSEFVKWMGRCPTCKEWNTIQEHAVSRAPASTSARPTFGSVRSRADSWLQDAHQLNFPVRVTDLYNQTTQEGSFSRRRQRLEVPNDEELNTVLGGGIMPGSITLVGGDPGVGKSTLLLQTAASLASLVVPTPGIGRGEAPQSDDGNDLGPVWYCSGEENPDQIASRARRLGVDASELWLLSETHADTLAELCVAHMKGKPDEENAVAPKPPSLLVVDSIQTMVCESGGASAAGGITQVRECVALFLRLAKSTGLPIVLVGHVTKSGDVAGPNTIAHMVDAVLYLEGVQFGGVTHNLRLLKATKNRFGSVDEVGVYEMTSGRLLPISDPSSYFLAQRVTEDDTEGCAVAIALEGLRAMTFEVQALVTPAGGNSGFGRRMANGVASSRLHLLLGVLQKRCGLLTARQDVYVNIAGRSKLDQGDGTSADLAITVALASSLTSIEVRADTAFVGEIGLLGELRPTPAIEKRLDEAKRMGFSRVVSPLDLRDRHKRSGKGNDASKKFTKWKGMEWIQCRALRDALDVAMVSPLPRQKRRRRASGSAAPGSLEQLEAILGDDEYDDDEYRKSFA